MSDFTLALLMLNFALSIIASMTLWLLTRIFNKLDHLDKRIVDFLERLVKVEANGGN
jgi:hypothetical protein